MNSQPDQAPEPYGSFATINARTAFQKPLPNGRGFFCHFRCWNLPLPGAKEGVRVYIEMPSHSPRILRGVEVPRRIWSRHPNESPVLAVRPAILRLSLVCCDSPSDSTAKLNLLSSTSLRSGPVPMIEALTPFCRVELGTLAAKNMKRQTSRITLAFALHSFAPARKHTGPGIVSWIGAHFAVKAFIFHVSLKLNVTLEPERILSSWVKRHAGIRSQHQYGHPCAVSRHVQTCREVGRNKCNRAALGRFESAHTPRGEPPSPFLADICYSIPQQSGRGKIGLVEQEMDVAHFDITRKTLVGANRKSSSSDFDICRTHWITKSRSRCSSSSGTALREIGTFGTSPTRLSPNHFDSRSFT